jgi:glyoxylase-like metal-dependent hydrolase (beta-lactamase superfamily II)
MSQAVKITREIFQVGGSGFTASEDAAIYLVNFDGHAALIDAGCGRALEKLLSNVVATGAQPEWIEGLLITHSHFDHTGGARALRQRLGCTVIAHDLDAGFIERGDDEVTGATWYGSTLEPCTVDRRLSGPREEIDFGGRKISVVHIPGHSPGSVAYVTESDGLKVVFAQDVHGPLHPSLLSNAADYQASLQRLVDLEADILCEGHYGIFTTNKDATEFIRSFMD